MADVCFSLCQATRVSEWLRRRGWNAREIQGDMPQKQRTDTVAAFKAGTMPLLIATDVAARGLDIPGVESVINYRRGPGPQHSLGCVRIF